MEKSRYLFVVEGSGSNEWIFDDFITGYTKARELQKEFRRYHIHADGSVTKMLLWTPSILSQEATEIYICGQNQTSWLESLGQGSGM